MDDDAGAAPTGNRPGRPKRHALQLRLDPAVHRALAQWADDELRSVNAQVEHIVRAALREAGRAPRDARPIPRRGRPSTGA